MPLSMVVDGDDRNVRVLTVREPWASAIVYGPKAVENRTWATSYRGLLAIHAGMSTAVLRDEMTMGRVRAAWPECPDEATLLGRRGFILGLAHLFDCVPAPGSEVLSPSCLPSANRP